MADPTSAKTPSRLRSFVSQIDPRSFLAGLALFTFVFAGTIGGFLISAAAGFIFLAVTSLVAAYFLGSSE